MVSPPNVTLGVVEALGEALRSNLRFVETIEKTGAQMFRLRSAPLNMTKLKYTK